MKVVNLFGPPGTGKSTIAAVLFGLLKMHQRESEFVPEFAKVLTWSDHHVALRDQLYVFAKQHHRLEMLRPQPLEFVISDGPLLNSLIYAPEKYYASFPSMVLEVFNSFDNFNVLLTAEHAYSPIGRYHTEQEAEQLQRRIPALLHRHGIPLHAQLSVNESTPATLYTLLTGQPLESGLYAAPPPAV